MRCPSSRGTFCYALRVRIAACFVAAVILPALTLPAGVAASRSVLRRQTVPPVSQQTTQEQNPLQRQLPPGQTPAVHAKPADTGPVIILDPAHGGTDTGARGETGAIEKDLVLDYARMVKSELESQGFRVVLTRNDDSNPSYADRAAIANAYRNGIFITLHISSTGTFGTVHTYYYKFGSAPTGPSVAPASSSSAGAQANSLVRWDEAQATHVDASRNLADALQPQLAQRFNGSPGAPTPAPVRQLRSIDEPAVAIEVASVSAQDSNTLAALAAPLAVAVARGLEAFRAAMPKAN